MTVLKNILQIARRECRLIFAHKIYLVCMLLMPCIGTAFFTTMMDAGSPMDMPVGVVDNDNTTMTRKLTRLLDSFQAAKVVAHYPSMDDARHAMQRGEIYGFVHFPHHMTDDLLAQRQPKVSFYYSSTHFTAGSLLFKEMKTMITLASAAVGQSVLTAKGVSKEMTMAILQPIVVDAHNIGNPHINYNVYLSNMLVPAIFLLFVILLTPYSMGTELKFGTSQELMAMADDNPIVAVVGKMIPHTVMYLFVMYAIMAYMYGYLHFPAPGGMWRLAFLGLLVVTATEGLALTIFALCPTLRMSLSLCSLMGMLSFSLVGNAFPVFAMDAPLQTLAWLFPLRHYYLILQYNIFNTFPLAAAQWHIVAMVILAFLPLCLAGRIGNAMWKGVYLP